MKTSRLTVGDKVMWRGAWNTEPPKKVTVESIELCPVGKKHGSDVQSVAWNTIDGGKRNVVVTLDNGHWAYGYQLKPIKK